MAAKHADERESVRQVFPNLDEDELSEAVIHLREYFTIAADICSREGKGTPPLIGKIDSPDRFSTMKERSNDDSLKT